MGIKGLLPFIPETVDKDGHISMFQNKTIGVDAMGWLYRGAYSCALELVTGGSTGKLQNFCRRRIQLLLNHNIRPILVFDGCPLPAKKDTDRNRREKKEHAKEKCMESLDKEDSKRAWKHAQSALSITITEMLPLMDICRDMDVQFIMAPYESDAQLAFLNRIGAIDAVISEDSDLIPYGCSVVLYKLDTEGNIDIYKKSRLESAFGGWNQQKIIEMCVLSGCDYCPSLEGIGAKTAFYLINTFGGLQQALDNLRKTRPHCITTTYENQARMAVHVFMHQRVFDPSQEKVITLTPVGNDVEQMTVETFIGPDLSPIIAANLAMGNLHPVTLEPLYDSPFIEALNINTATTATTVTVTSRSNSPTIPLCIPILPIPRLNEKSSLDTHKREHDTFEITIEEKLRKRRRKKRCKGDRKRIIKNPPLMEMVRNNLMSINSRLVSSVIHNMVPYQSLLGNHGNHGDHNNGSRQGRQENHSKPFDKESLLADLRNCSDWDM